PGLIARGLLFAFFPRSHAAEADVGHAGVRGAAVPGAGPVAQAVRRVAKKGAAHPRRGAHSRPAGLYGAPTTWSLRGRANAPRMLKWARFFLNRTDRVAEISPVFRRIISQVDNKC